MVLAEPNEREAIERNLFPEARAAIRDWDAFPWHRDGRKVVTAGLVQSSQALAIDFFGTIAQLVCRDSIFRTLGNTWGFTQSKCGRQGWKNVVRSGKRCEFHQPDAIFELP